MGLERVGVAATATLIPTLLLVHGLTAVLHASAGISPGAVAVSVAVTGVGLLHALVEWRRAAVPLWVWVVTSAVAATMLVVFTTAGMAAALATATACTAQGWAQSRVARSLPATVDGLFRRRPWVAGVWTALALLAVVQTARLSAHEADVEVDWWVTTRDPDWAAHMCMSAYVYAADLHRQGETNVYDAAHYPYSDGSATPHPSVENLEAHIADPFPYPPPFLLLPWTALQLTNDFYVFRPVWFALQGLGFLAVAIAVARWIGGKRGERALWLLPAVWVAVPTLQNFQYGQFQISAIALALAGMLAIESKRSILGGALLGAAVVTKIYPGILLLLLVSQRRWRELGTTLAWVLGFGLLGLAVLGAAPYEAFFTYHLPRILSGEAFLQGDIITAITVGIGDLPGKLRLLGVTSSGEVLGPWLGRAGGVALAVLALTVGRRAASRSRRAILWLALLNLVVLQGPAAFIDYVPATSLWLLTLVSVEMTKHRTLAVALGVCWLHLSLLIGTFPTPTPPPIERVAASGVLASILILALNLWCALRSNLDPEGGPTRATPP